MYIKLIYKYKKLYDSYVQTYPKKLSYESYFSVSNLGFHVESGLQRLCIYYRMLASSPCLITKTNLRIPKFQRPCRLSIH